jgi:UDP-2-acetamido-2,6-beta-L-arabino-hexul-4-ose reductase
MDVSIRNLNIQKDERGWLAEVLRPADVGNKKFGQLLITVAKPGQTKGGHFHKQKREWYLVIAGKARLTLTNKITHETMEIILEDNKPRLVEMPKLVHHQISNIGNTDMTLLVYVSEEFDINNPDTYK